MRPVLPPLREADWTTHHASTLAPGVAAAIDVAVDAQGLVTVLGYTTVAPFGFDYSLTRYDPAGSQVWMVTQDGGAIYDAIPQALALDASGNAYVAFRDATAATSWDMVVAKFDPAGNRRWNRRYDGPAHLSDQPVDVGVDSEGNVVVTGRSEGEDAWPDMVTAKYDPEGALLWVDRYEGEDESLVYPVDLAPGPQGDVIVLGAVRNALRSGYLTMKYTADGQRAWETEFTPPGSQVGDPAACAVDDSGNVCVTGRGLVRGSLLDFNTVSYSAEGQQQWTARFDGPGNSHDTPVAIALDAAGNCYVTGWSRIGRSDYACSTVKYNPRGTQDWQATYNAPQSDRCFPTALALDDEGRVVVTGRSISRESGVDIVIVRYTPDGEKTWAEVFTGSAISEDVPAALALGPDGAAHVVGYTDSGDSLGRRSIALSYNADGEHSWTALHHSMQNSKDELVDLGMDGRGNVYAVGTSLSRETGYDILLTKVDAEGHEVWSSRYSGEGWTVEVATALAVDDRGNICVTGWRGPDNNSADYLTLKFSPEGVLLWSAFYDGPDHTGDVALGIALDADGCAYVTGGSSGIGSATDFATIKYRPDGSPAWVSRYDGPARFWDSAYGVAVDTMRNVYVTGGSIGEGSGLDFATIKYSPDGVQEWVTRYNSQGNRDDSPHALASDQWGNVYVTGEIDLLATNPDYGTMKYGPDGELLWMVRYNGPGNGFDVPEDMAVDWLGNVYVTGWSDGIDQRSRFATIKYNLDGVEQWVARFADDEPGSGIAEAVVVDAAGSVYVTGWHDFGVGAAFDMTTVKYDSRGNQQWAARYNGPGNTDDEGISLAVDEDGNVFAGGYSWGHQAGWQVFSMLKYSGDATAVDQPREPDAPASFRLFQNYPNPMSPNQETVIRYSLPTQSHVRLTVYNLTAQVVARLADQEEPVGEHAVSWHPADIAPGVYVYRLEAGRFSEARKLVVTK